MINAVALSNVGNKRNNHEDNYLIGIHQFIDKTMQKKMVSSTVTAMHTYCGYKGIFMVSDGMGGHSSGEVASFQAIKWLNEHYGLLLNSTMGELQQYMSKLNDDIREHAKQNQEWHDMGATLTGLIFSEDKAYCVNVGDSRVYHFYEDRLKQITKDHTEGQRMLELQLLNSDEVERFPSRKALYKYIGYQGKLLADVGDLEVVCGDMYLICSDGLTDVLDVQQIENIFKGHSAVEAIGENLLNSVLACKEKCSDNITVIVLEIA